MTIQPLRDYSAYLPYARALTARRRTDPQLAARRERAWAVAREIAGFLREQLSTRAHPRLWLAVVP